MPNLQEVSKPNLLEETFPHSLPPRILFSGKIWEEIDGRLVEFDPNEAMKRDLRISDTTFRDGQQARPPYTVDQIVGLFKLLSKLGGPKGLIRMSEFFVYSKKDREAIEAVRDLGLEFPKVTGWIRADKGDLAWVRKLDLTETGMVFCSGNERDAIYRLTSEDELGVFQEEKLCQGPDDLVWALIYRQGPLAYERIAKLGRLSSAALDEALGRLLAAGRISKVERQGGVFYYSEKLVIPLGSSDSWEASVYDHYHAVVKTICNRVDPDSGSEKYGNRVGGATYTFDVGPDHPLEQEVLDTLNKIRALCGDLRKRVVAYNEKHGVCHPHEHVVVYAGQSVIPQEEGEDIELPSDTKGRAENGEGLKDNE